MYTSTYRNIIPPKPMRQYADTGGSLIWIKPYVHTLAMNLENCNIFMDIILCIYYSNITSYQLYRNIPIAVDMDMTNITVWLSKRLYGSNVGKA